MLITGKDMLDTFKRDHPPSRKPLSYWQELMEKASFRHLEDVKKTWGSADYYKPITGFNIHGNDYRLESVIDYKSQIIAIRDIMTHAEYDRKNKSRRG
jgi:mRNA interferase HigB